MTSNLKEKLRDPEYRKAFVASQINVGIPFQIRAMLKNRPGWTQETLAKRADMLQPRISGLMTPGKTRPNIETLRRIAEAFDCGLVVRFAPFSELAGWSEEFDPETFSVPDFEHDAGFIERKEPEVAAAATPQYDFVAVTERGGYIVGEAKSQIQMGTAQDDVVCISNSPKYHGNDISNVRAAGYRSRKTPNRVIRPEAALNPPTYAIAQTQHC